MNLTPDLVVEQYGRLVPYFVNRFRHYFNASGAYGEEDLMQVGYLELYKASEKFDAVLGFKFTTFASYCILGGVLRFIRDNTAGMRLPRRTRLHQRINHVGSLNVVLDDKGHELMDLIEDRDSYGAVELHELLKTLLSDQEQLVFRLSVEGYSQREIGTRIGVKQAQAGRILNRSRARIAAALEGGEAIEGMGGHVARAHNG